MNVRVNIPPHIKLFRRIADRDRQSGVRETLLAKFSVLLPDRPGSLAGFASAIAESNGNISFFHYDRSLHSNRVAVEVQLADEPQLERLLASLTDKHFAVNEAPGAQDDVLVTAVDGILEIKVLLANQPGTLAAFARLLSEHNANVTYMLYDEDIDAGSADIALVTADPEEIDGLLRAINERGCHYRVVYRGNDGHAAENIIGLKMIERFFLRLKRLLASSDVAEIMSLVESSRDLQQDLVQFATESGKHLEAGDVFETVLTFASCSRNRVGARFIVQDMKPLRFSDQVDLMGFRLPTSENIYLFRVADELTMIDAGHGIYYNDLKKLLASRGMDPAQVRRMFITHPDTDHIGTAGYFEREYGTEVFMHAGGAEVIANTNRAYGASGSLLNLNKYYTRLSNRFTDCGYPTGARYFPAASGRTFAGFNVLDTIAIGSLQFDVLESYGSHTPGLVFYLNREFGLLFTSDFLLNVKSLSAGDKEHLGIYRYLLTNPNRDSRLYKEETAALRSMMLPIEAEAVRAGRHALILPGHGDYYDGAELTAR